MLGSPAVEIDFFRLKDEPSSKKLSDRPNIQGVISKINPELLRTAIASASTNNSFVSFGQQSQTLPVYKLDSESVQMGKTVAPLTIFYNGSVLVFDVSPDQAEKIMKLATESAGFGSGSDSNLGVKMVGESVKKLSNVQNPLGGVLARSDLPLSRKKSLRRFLEKRKERQVSVSPYAFSQGSESSH
ncbi:protein TIFY 9-like [Rutidosis leptorrhynchoides]|uniref:protein TIFY 9-like n=1 Tax=Rutidosis leptorrhynchoides TaxID=125765 RepID=UPI003A998592